MRVGENCAEERKHSKHRDCVEEGCIWEGVVSSFVRFVGFAGDEQSEDGEEHAEGDTCAPNCSPNIIVVFPSSSSGVPRVRQGKDVQRTGAAISRKERLSEGQGDGCSARWGWWWGRLDPRRSGDKEVWRG